MEQNGIQPMVERLRRIADLMQQLKVEVNKEVMRKTETLKKIQELKNG